MKLVRKFLNFEIRLLDNRSGSTLRNTRITTSSLVNPRNKLIRVKSSQKGSLYNCVRIERQEAIKEHLSITGRKLPINDHNSSGISIELHWSMYAIWPEADLFILFKPSLVKSSSERRYLTLYNVTRHGINICEVRYRRIKATLIQWKDHVRQRTPFVEPNNLTR